MAELTPSMVAVADGVHAYLQQDGGWYLNNAVLITGPDAAITVDTAATEARTRAYRAAISRVTDVPVRTLVATHHHGDHTHGNHLFPEATVVSHTYCRERVLRDDYHAVLALFTGPSWGDIRPAAPGLTFRDTLTLWSGDRRVELRHPGRAAHTRGDVYAWLPDDRVLISGDLVFNGGTPLLAEGSPGGLARTLEELGELDPEVVVPGHGGPAGPELLLETLEYLTWLRQLARAAHADGLAPLDAARQADLGRWAALREPERLVANIHSGYAEITGTPVDMTRLAADMIELNGGLIHCHA
ncbi:MBL fold metallo-hydrolase [Streptomyces sp. SL13]|uniref:MBL fold metallo-hydrolase n=1 Tax=Streptantibioticus silvisoli TaxID=2705255 RepID=A0AA90KI54_9ACTN|nr:MBL fold metallo-hydrolase [Streptantibioticus silvisoli]MDI5972630.1 MBL fold metallo-hydrolase [Streptantibioticus silvisoli]